MKTKFRTILAGLALISASILLLDGCNTVQGIGKDIKHGGQAIQKAAGGSSSNKNSTKQTKNGSTMTTPNSSTQTTTTTVQPNAPVTQGY